MNKLFTFALLAALASSVSVQAKDTNEILGFPSTIPHPVDSYLPITPEKNMCVMCHKEQKGRTAQKMEIPSTHFINKKLDPSRHECLLCHAPVQTQATPEPVDPNAGI